METKSVQQPFSEAEIEFLSSKGNQKMNRTLLKNFPKWVADPSTFRSQQLLYSFVRIWYIQRKYINLAFNKHDEFNYPIHDLNKFWYYIDEYSSRKTKSVGPVTREKIQRVYEKAELNQHDLYAWHPSISKNWIKIRKIRQIINKDLEDNKVYKTHEQMLKLQNYRLPHLKGALECRGRFKAQKKWVILACDKLYVYTYKQLSNTELEINLRTISEITLQDHNASLMLNIVYDNNHLISLGSKLPNEVLEWYESINCSWTILSMFDDEDLDIPIEDASEFHICNVKQSDEYQGNKMFEGILKKEGSFIKSIKTRWFILRNTGLYYYTSQDEKNCRGKILLSKDSFIDKETWYKYPYHFSLTTANRTIHMWAETQWHHTAWVNALQSAIVSLNFT